MGQAPVLSSPSAVGGAASAADASTASSSSTSTMTTSTPAGGARRSEGAGGGSGGGSTRRVPHSPNPYGVVHSGTNSHYGDGNNAKNNNYPPAGGKSSSPQRSGGGGAGFYRSGSGGGGGGRSGGGGGSRRRLGVGVDDRGGRGDEHGEGEDYLDDDDDEDDDDDSIFYGGGQSCFSGGGVAPIMRPGEAASVLGRSEVRRLVRACRRAVALSVPLSSQQQQAQQQQQQQRGQGGQQPQHNQRRGGGGAGAASDDGQLARWHGIYCYDGSDLLFLEDETDEEGAELDAIVDCFFPSPSVNVKEAPAPAAKEGMITETTASGRGMHHHHHHQQQQQQPQRRSVLSTPPPPPRHNHNHHHHTPGGTGTGTVVSHRRRGAELLSSLVLEYPAFRHVLVPPHAFVPQGVVECIFASLSSPAPPPSVIGGMAADRSSMYPNASRPSSRVSQMQQQPDVRQQQQQLPTRSVVRLADLIIYLAALRVGGGGVGGGGVGGIVERRAAVAFRVYQSVHGLRASAPGGGGGGQPQRGQPAVQRGQRPLVETRIDRDTASRFVYNVYGNETLQSDGTVEVLDGLFGGGDGDGGGGRPVGEEGDGEHGAGRRRRRRRRKEDEESQGEGPDEEMSDGGTEDDDDDEDEEEERPRPASDLVYREFVEGVARQAAEAAGRDGDDDGDGDTHLLTRWLEVLAVRMFPPRPPPPDVVALEERYARPSRALHLLCARHRLSPLMLLECKRKFYSLLATAAANADSADALKVAGPQALSDGGGGAPRVGAVAVAVEDSDAAGAGGEEDTVDEEDDEEDEEEEALGSTSPSAQAASGRRNGNRRGRNGEKVLDGETWVRAVSRPSGDETGPGFLPPALASFTFRAGCRHRNHPHSSSSPPSSSPAAGGRGDDHDDGREAASFHSLHRTYSSAAVASMKGESDVDGSGHDDDDDGASGTEEMDDGEGGGNGEIDNGGGDGTTANGGRGEAPASVPAREGAAASGSRASAAAAVGPPRPRPRCDCLWSLYDFVAFGCTAGRADLLVTSPSSGGGEEELPLLRFAFRVFLESGRGGGGDGGREGDGHGGAPDRHDLSREQVGRMILLLLEHAAFRGEGDHCRSSMSPPRRWGAGVGGIGSGDGGAFHDVAPPRPRSEEYTALAQRTPPVDPSEVVVSAEDAVAMGFPQSLLGGNCGRARGRGEGTSSSSSSSSFTEAQMLAGYGQEEGAPVGGVCAREAGAGYFQGDGGVSLATLVELTLREAEAEAEADSDPVGNGGARRRRLSFEGFVRWHRADRKRRLGPYLGELRLLAGATCGVRPSTPRKERDIVREVFRRHKLRHPETPRSPRGPEGTLWYLVASSWMDKWNAYSSQEGSAGYHEASPSSPSSSSSSARTEQRQVMKGARPMGAPVDAPPPIDNNALLRPGSLVLRPGIGHVRDFLLVPPLVWSALQAWHDGGPPIYRKVVRQGRRGGALASAADGGDAGAGGPPPLENEIELHPLCLTIALADASTGLPRPFQQWQLVSKIEPARALVEDLCVSLNVPPHNARLWRMPSHGQDERVETLLDLDLSLSDQAHAVEDGGILMLELRNDDGGWPRRAPVDGGSAASASSSGRRGGGANGADSARRGSGRGSTGPGATATGDGVVGLYNMGNTCYLNSSIQCLSHTPLLREYFTSKSYLSDINTTNPLGQQGRLAQVSATLICQLWKAGASGSSLTPKSFKDAIGKFNDDFAGNEQHDAQELLAFLLSGLSEDLNRIVTKPYIEQPDSDGRPDRELADIWWRNHLLREMSIIVALFTGQYKSLLTCKKCGYESARFEPFAFLQLPLPEDDLIPISMIVYPIDDSRQIMKYSVRVHKEGTIEDALICLAKILHADEVASSRASATGDDEMANNGNASNANSSKGGTVGDKQKLLSRNDSASLLEDAEEEMYRDMASNLAVVDMRECRINSITPSSRSLAQLRETEVLCVFELEPLASDEVDGTAESAEKSSESCGDVKEEEVAGSTVDADCDVVPGNDTDGEMSEGSHTGDDNGDMEESDGEEDGESRPNEATRKNSPDTKNAVAKKPRPDYIALAQRRLEPISRPFLHPYTMRVFDTPLLLRLYLGEYTGKELYDLVAARFLRFVPNLPPVEEKIDPITSNAVSRGGHPAQSAPSTGSVVGCSRDDPPHDACNALDSDPRELEGRKPTTIEMEQTAGGVYPRHGFRLRFSSRDGRRCSRCPWFECCIGCEVPDNEAPTVVQDGDTIAVDWHLSSPSSRDKPEAALSAAKEQALSLACVERHRTCRWGGKDITLEECLDSFAREEEIPETYCSQCKDFHSSTKRMSIWRLPPIMMIHLKRFQFTQHFRRKLRNMVVFPTEGLDLSRIVVSDCSADASEGASSPLHEKSKECAEESSCINGDRDKSNHQSNAASASGDCSIDNDGPKAPRKSNDEGKPGGCSNKGNVAWIGSSDGRSESLYDLYGVVHHLGALTGGHYVASIRSEIDGRWRLFNDAQVSEINSRDIIDASAYILFYVRRDVRSAKLDDLWDTSSRVGEGVTEEQIDKLVKQRERCVIS